MTRHVTYKELSNTSSESSQKILPDMLRFVFVYDTRFPNHTTKDVENDRHDFHYKLCSKKASVLILNELLK